MAYILNVDRPELRIHQAVKGEAFGCLEIDGQNFKGGSTIPPDLSKMKITKLPKWILVIEKYAVYERLLSSGFTKDKPCLLVTGRGIN